MASDKYFSEIVSFIDLYALKMENGCWKWVGRTRGSADEDKYYKVWFYCMDNNVKVRKQFLVHKLSYFGHNKIDYVSEGLELSHICGMKRCVNPAHIIAESHQINKERQHCHGQSICSGHNPPCIC